MMKEMCIACQLPNGYEWEQKLKSRLKDISGLDNIVKYYQVHANMSGFIIKSEAIKTHLFEHIVQKPVTKISTKTKIYDILHHLNFDNMEITQSIRLFNIINIIEKLDHDIKIEDHIDKINKIIYNINHPLDDDNDFSDTESLTLYLEYIMIKNK